MAGPRYNLSMLSAPAGYTGAAEAVKDIPDTTIKVANSNRDKASGASTAAVTTLHLSAILVGVALVLLWVLGGIVFRDANL